MLEWKLTNFNDLLWEASNTIDVVNSSCKATFKVDKLSTTHSKESDVVILSVIYLVIYQMMRL